MKLTIDELLDIQDALSHYGVRLADRGYDTGNVKYSEHAARIDNLRAKVAVLAARRGDVQ